MADRDGRSLMAGYVPLEIIYNGRRCDEEADEIVARCAAILHAIADLGQVGLQVVKTVLEIAAEQRHGQVEVVRDAAGFLDLDHYEAVARRHADKVVLGALMRGLRRIEPGEMGLRAA
jgi:hypothetical protein